MKIRAVGDNPYLPSGYSNNLVQIFFALQRLGHDAKIIWPSQLTENVKIKAVATDVDDIDKDTYVLVRAYNEPYFHAVRTRAKFIATILVLEGSRLPERWVYIANQCDQVWASSNYNKEMLIKNGVVPSLIKVIPHGCDLDYFFPYGPVENSKEYGFPFIFLWMGGHSLPGDRKGGDDLVRAFHGEFDVKENVQLLIKINTVYSGNFDSVGHLKSVSNDDPRIIYITKDMPEGERADLYRSADCFVSPHKGEAFGMTNLEALACGVPVITTGYSGVMDYCNDENSFLIKKWSVWPAHYGMFDIVACSNWVDLILKSLRNCSVMLSRMRVFAKKKEL